MDLDIFDLFNNDDSNDDLSLLIDFSEHPLFWIKGFNKIIGHHIFFKEYAVKMFKKAVDLDDKDLERAGEEFMFRRAWDYIKDIDLNKSFHIECLKTTTNDEFVSNLQITIKFFERYEEYEKCALLKNIEEKIKEFLN